jgi:hypothetical protein
MRQQIDENNKNHENYENDEDHDDSYLGLLDDNHRDNRFGLN